MYEIYDYLETVEDPRQLTKVKHKVSDILVLVLLGTLVECDNFVEIEEFGKLCENDLKGYLSLENGIPSHDTIQRVMSFIDPSVTAELQLKWAKLSETGETEKLKKIINIDGKTMRGNRSAKQNANHVVSAYSKSDSICFGQLTVEEKSNEITAIPKLLSQITVKDCIVTIDAMGTQTAIAEKIIEKKADYVLALKENQGTLYDDVVTYLDFPDFQKAIKAAGDYQKTIEKAHGQLETREYYQTSDIAWLDNKAKWSKLTSIGMVKTTLEKNGARQTETRYYISSLPVEIVQFAKAIREHWAIEIMHWHLDVSFGEDANKTLHKTAALNHSNIRKLALAILKDMEMRKKKMSIRLKRFSLTVAFARYLGQIFSM